MKTIREIFDTTSRMSVTYNGEVVQWDKGELFPDDLEWRIQAAIEYRLNSFSLAGDVREMVVELVEDVCETHTRNVFDRYYPEYLGGNSVRIKEWRNNRVVSTVLKLSKFLHRVAPSLPAHRVRDIVDIMSLQGAPLEVSLTRDPDAILAAYQKVISCMSKSGVAHLPLIYLQDPAMKLAVITASGRIIGRCWVRGDKMTRYYTFRVFDSEVCKLLEGMFEINYDFLRGVKFKCREFPYLDSCVGRVDFDGEFVTPNPRGKWTTTKTGRIISFR